jgi:Ca2+-transporting ATPase
MGGATCKKKNNLTKISFFSSFLSRFSLMRFLSFFFCSSFPGICSDKTGTLTENRMTVMKAVLGLKEHQDFKFMAIANKVKDLLAIGIAVNSTAFIIQKENGATEHVGSKTECALLDMAKILEYDYNQLRRDFPAKKTFPFSSERKSMSTVIELPATSTTSTSVRHRFFTKGASEIVLSMCDYVIDAEGTVTSISPHRDFLNSVIGRMASEGLRTIALAYLDVSRDPSEWTSPPTSGLVLIGITGIKDPVRKEVPAAVRACQEAGITVRMLTGDNKETARSIARECGILVDSGDVIEGPVFRKLSDEQVLKNLPSICVMARCSPQDKYRLVELLQQSGEVVAVTGDGTNDAPQLEKADVGFAMGIAGTEVAKEASDIILLGTNRFTYLFICFFFRF